MLKGAVRRIRITPDILLRLRSDDGVEVGVRQVERVRGTDAEGDRCAIPSSAADRRAAPRSPGPWSTW
jgi:hypothetical protein